MISFTMLPFSLGVWAVKVVLMSRVVQGVEQLVGSLSMSMS